MLNVYFPLVSFCSFYREGLKTIENFQSYIDELSENVHKIKMRHDEEKKKLLDLRNLLKTSLSLDKEVWIDIL